LYIFRSADLQSDPCYYYRIGSILFIDINRALRSALAWEIWRYLWALVIDIIESIGSFYRINGILSATFFSLLSR